MSYLRAFWRAISSPGNLDKQNLNLSLKFVPFEGQVTDVTGAYFLNIKANKYTRFLITQENIK
jgi:hypothetical protein